MQNEQSEAIKAALHDKLKAMLAKKEAGETILPEERIKVAVLADSPTVVTGFGNVCREILTNLYATGMYDFDVVGINYDGKPHDFPFRIYPAVNGLMLDPAYRDPYGKQQFLDLLGEGRFDIAWILQDSFIVGEELGQRIAETNEALDLTGQFGTIFYFPIDATPKKSWIDGSVMLADFPVVYTKYGYDEVLNLYSVGADTLLKPDEQERNVEAGKLLAEKLSVIHHGVNMTDFYPIDNAELVSEFREKYWGDKKDKFVFMNVNRNQPRKDLFRTMQAFKLLLDARRAQGKDDVYLYLHCNVFDNGMNLLDMAKQIGIVEGEEFAYPNPKAFGPSAGFPIETLNQLYNAADAIVTTTLGEGWGLSITEAMAVKKPILAPDHTSITEMLGKIEGGGAERGFLVKTRGEFVQQNDNARVRPLTDPEDMAAKMAFVMENRTLVQPIVDAAYDWVSKLQWNGQEIMASWHQVFMGAYNNALGRRALKLDASIASTFKKQGLGRNDECPMCKEKIKNCRHATFIA